MKSFSRTILTAILVILAIASAASAAQYHPGDVAVIKNIIKNNLMTSYDPDRPEQWDFVTWSNSSPKRAVGLDFSAEDTPYDGDGEEGEPLDGLGVYGALDITKLSEITALYCGGFQNSVSEIDASGCKKLKSISCTSGSGPDSLCRLNISGCIALEELRVSMSLEADDPKQRIAALYDGCTELKILWIEGCLPLFDLSKFPKLEELDCSDYGYDDIETLDLSRNPELTTLDCSRIYMLRSINISNNSNLRELDCSYNKNLSALDISKNTELEWVICKDTGIKHIDTKNNPKLEYISID